MDFVHLHVHTQYSILDGAASVKSLVKEAVKNNMPALAITDHGNMYGAKEFYDQAVKEGIKPILGCETYIVDDHNVKSRETERRCHLILLAKNETGYHNLIRLVSIGFTEGSYYGKPRIDMALLREMHEGLICCSACIAGQVQRAVLADNMVEAERVALEYKELFGDDYYLEMQYHRPTDPSRPVDVYPKQDKVNKAFAQLSKRLGIKLIVTNDIHFTHADDADAHDHLICLNTGRDLDDPNRMRYTGEEYFKTPEQMAALFPDHPEALANTIEIANKVELYQLDHAPLMPNFPIPDDFAIDSEALKRSFVKKITDPSVVEQIDRSGSVEEFVAANPSYADQLTVAKQFLYLTHLTWEGIKVRYPDLTDQIRERVDYELATIERMGFPGYFLIVWDYIRAAREMGVSVGPGRGSAAGSVVAYALKITNIDPIKYDLLFERFLNPDRISLPDVDVDFDEDGREKVLHYVIEKYGSKRVAQIVTFGTMAPKLAIRDVARVQKLSLAESDRLAKLVPDKLSPDKGETPFEWVYREVPELAKERESDNPLIRNTLQLAEKLEGSVRQTGVHACGVIIGQDDLEKFAPVATAKDAELNVVQFEGKYVESVGLIKMDFLGLKTLSIIKDALENVERTTARKIDIDAIPLDDRKTYTLFSRGETTGIFQFESPGMKKYLRALKPSRLEDLIAMNALYRPGPMDKIPNFIARKSGDEKVTYEFPEMETYLADTYGITVYQEQVMLLSQLLAGFTGGQADTLRKAMGKKKRDVLDKMKPKFLEGALERGHDKATCEDIWGQWEAFASYAFNKSHATCYAYVAYQTAYLKAHYPSEFMAALLSRNLTIDKITTFMDECKRMGIKVLGPDVNESINSFTADREGNVRFGMAGIKGVGDAAVKSIIAERDENGRFKDLFDFFERINYTAVNRKCIENLALAGAFDALSGCHRSRLLTGEQPFIDTLIKYGQRVQFERDNSQQSLFGGSASHAELMRPVIPVVEEWSQLETLSKERDMIGMYLSSHPLDDFKAAVTKMCTTPLTEFANLNEMLGKDFSTGGMITKADEYTTKSGKLFGRFVLEDYSGSYTFAMFGKDYENYRKYIYEKRFVVIRGTVRRRTYGNGDAEVAYSSVQFMNDVQEQIREFVVTLPVGDITPDLIADLTGELKRSKGKAQFKVRIVDPRSGVTLTLFSKTRRVNVTKELLEFCENNQMRYTIL